MDKVFIPYLERIEKEIQLALPLHGSEVWKKNSFGVTPSCLKEEHYFPLVETTRSLVDLGGKRWRPMFLILVAESCMECGKSSSFASVDNAYHLAPLVEFVHTASLIHDDIEDGSDTRRGKPAAYITYGMDTAINAGSWLYFMAPVCIDTLAAPVELKNSLYASYALELRRLHLGQAMDIRWHRESYLCPTPDEYVAMVKCKTGTLASLAARIGSVCAGCSESDAAKAGEYASVIGAGFQVIDDVINLTKGNPGKKRGDDIVEGKKSLPVLLYAQKYGVNSKEFSDLCHCFEDAKKSGIESPSVEKAISMLAESGVIEVARKQGIEFIEEGCASFEELFGKENSGVKKIKNLFTSMIPVAM